MNKVDRLFATLMIIGFMLIGVSACSQEPKIEYNKTTGEVVGKHISGGRYGDSYYIDVSYSIRNGKYIIDTIDVDKGEYDNYHEKDKVTVYGNDKGIGGIVK